MPEDVRTAAELTLTAGLPLPVPGVPVNALQGTLALDLHPRLGPPWPEQGRPAGDGQGSPRRRLEEWARRFVQCAAEIVSGDRPVSQLLRWTTPRVYEDLARRAQLEARASGRSCGQGRPAGAVRPQVRGLRACFLTDDVVEVGVRVRYGERSRAVAARFELLAGRWQCTALEFA